MIWVPRRKLISLEIIQCRFGCKYGRIIYITNAGNVIKTWGFTNIETTHNFRDLLDSDNNIVKLNFNWIFKNTLKILNQKRHRTTRVGTSIRQKLTSKTAGKVRQRHLLFDRLTWNSASSNNENIFSITYFECITSDIVWK